MIFKFEWQSDLPTADRHPQTDSIKREGNKFKLVSVSENIVVVTKCGSRDGAAVGLTQLKQN